MSTRVQLILMYLLDACGSSRYLCIQQTPKHPLNHQIIYYLLDSYKSSRHLHVYQTHSSKQISEDLLDTPKSSCPKVLYQTFPFIFRIKNLKNQRSFCSVPRLYFTWQYAFWVPVPPQYHLHNFFLYYSQVIIFDHITILLLVFDERLLI